MWRTGAGDGCSNAAPTDLGAESSRRTEVLSRPGARIGTSDGCEVSRPLL